MTDREYGERWGNGGRGGGREGRTEGLGWREVERGERERRESWRKGIKC